ncbi:MAG: methionyl-tRNA formyltransferase [Candidatus Harrisonbacteria bacterium RIFCSPLOWO2_02_FULL_41_13b]|uniref:Methionyl-tRNA formyltransferase n=1 Tax=Candidatus Harrisonbacteria bacterium RIFCSPLOWO2_02_FULL_41_13b TaxID=1798409 RepID=A0A1G1ZQD1_9BACT|nr:MAG: methionyl-tRNA formyltransferase [Candidatus Harrisonbacteria bacterium RIFCSPHIGHO2_02_FULL_40_20]OGY66659.1 MAG: methionyl-tRNA formyltransferase [Candidatus Harrisonbacteria bacterium RIFCSPLOWO2_02_FULL_41_13b]
MRYIFFGTPNFAAIILEKLIKSSLIPSAVVCNPDRPIGRKKNITPPPTKSLALHYNIPILQPEILTNNKLQITNYKPDFFVVAAFSKILSKEILQIPRLGTIGIHPSLLPKYRGATPIQTAILNGDIETGTTLYLIDEKIDHGAIVANIKYSISNIKKYEETLKDLAELSADLLIKTLPKFKNGEIKPQLQNENESSYTKKFTSQDGYIEPDILEKAQGGDLKLATDIDRRIRALNPEPGTYTIQNGKRVKLLEAQIQNGKLRITKLQIEGKKTSSV